MSEHLRSIYDRWSRLEGVKAEISEDLRELFAEAKSSGYDAKALRAAFRIKSMNGDDYLAWNEHLCLVDSYVHALGDAPPIGTAIATPAHPRIAREEPSLERPAGFSFPAASVTTLSPSPGPRTDSAILSSFTGAVLDTARSCRPGPLASGGDTPASHSSLGRAVEKRLTADTTALPGDAAKTDPASNSDWPDMPSFLKRGVW